MLQGYRAPDRADCHEKNVSSISRGGYEPGKHIGNTVSRRPAGLPHQKPATVFKYFQRSDIVPVSLAEISDASQRHAPDSFNNALA